jgi:hypothetical protein
MRAGLGGVSLEVFNPLPGSELSLEFFSPMAGSSFLVAGLSMIALEISELPP